MSVENISGAESEPVLIGLGEARAIYREGVRTGGSPSSLANRLALPAIERFEEVRTAGQGDEAHYRRERKVYSKLVMWVAKLVVRGELIADLNENISIDAGAISGDMTHIEAIWNEFFPEERSLDEKTWAKLSLCFSPNDLTFWLRDTTENPYASPANLRWEIQHSKDPEASLRSKTELCELLMAKYSGTNPYAGPTEIKEVLRTGENPEARLQAQIALYDRLITEYAGKSFYARPYEIRTEVRRSRDPETSLRTRIDLYDELTKRYSDTSPYAGPHEIRTEVRRSSNPESSLLDKIELYERLLKEYSVISPYAGPVEIKTEVRISKNPETSLRTKIELYERLSEEYAEIPESVIKHVVRDWRHKSKPEHLTAKLQDIDDRARRFAASYNVSFRLACWLSLRNQDNAEGLRQHLQAMSLLRGHIMSLDANRSMTSFFSLYDKVADDSEIRQEEAKEAEDKLAQLIDAGRISEAEKEALMLAFIDQDRESVANHLGIEVNQVNTYIDGLLAKLRRTTMI